VCADAGEARRRRLEGVGEEGREWTILDALVPFSVLSVTVAVTTGCEADPTTCQVGPTCGARPGVV
jgi:hypothetical protein